MARQRVSPSGGGSSKSLMDIGSPRIDWVSLARGMGVAAFRTTTSSSFAAELNSALERKGPTLIEASLA